MVRKRLLLLASALLALPALTPSTAHASLDLKSSMSAVCIGEGGSCDLVRFALSVPDQLYNGQSYVSAVLSRIGIMSSTAANWAFDRVTQIENTSKVLYEEGGDSNLWGWGKVGGSEFWVENNSGFSGVFPSQPVYLTIAMTAAGFPASDPNFSELTYDANGYVNPAGSPTVSTQFSTGGTVTPEPVSMLLLGSGLAGVAGVARRKRSQADELVA
jgi:hypothetical protein